MLEQEIAFHVPPDQQKALEAALRALDGKPRQRLQALYFDTPDRQLARQRVALRLRREGRRWVQTLKMAGADPLSRVELNHPRPQPELDLDVYVGTPAAAVLAALDAPLSVRFETDVQRLARDIETPEGRVEVALDLGVIRAGGFELPLSEIEFEHKAGRLDAIFQLSGRWLPQYGLVMETRSKAQRGDALARAALRIAAADQDEQEDANRRAVERLLAPVGAVWVEVPPQATPVEALIAHTQDCWTQIAGNANRLAAVDGLWADGLDVEYVHQLRVGLRRLRSVWRLLRGLVPPVPEALEIGAREQAQVFGAARDIDVLVGDVWPRLSMAGMPQVTLPPAPEVDASRLAASPVLQGWLLDTLAWLVQVPAQVAEDEARWEEAAAAALEASRAQAESQASAETSADAEAESAAPSRRRLLAAAPVTSAEVAAVDDIPVSPWLDDTLTFGPAVARELARWHRRLMRQAKRFAQLSEADRHALRKLAKRLRYGLQAAEGVLPRGPSRRYRKRLAVLQELLGEMNDLYVARDYFAGLRNNEPAAWFAMGWIAARVAVLDGEVAQAVQELRRASALWRGR